MHFSRGKTRFVIAFPSFSFVIKFPLILFLQAAKNFCGDAVAGRWKLILRTFTMRVENPYGVPAKLLGGIWANLLEFYFWKKTRNPFLYPTWFSFFGLFNIQKYGEPLSYREEWVGCMVRRLSHGESMDSGHGFETPLNYSSENGTLRMIDYGNRRMWPVLEKFGHDFMRITIEECRSEELACNPERK